MTADDSGEWTHGEIVRGLNRVTDALVRIESKVDGLGERYVSRELFDEHRKAAGDRISALALEVTDLRADHTRREKERADERTEAARERTATWRWGVGLTVSVVLVVLAQLLLFVR